MSIRMKNLILLVVWIFAIVVAGFIAVRAQLPAGYNEVPLAFGSSNELFGLGMERDCWIREVGIYDEAKLKPLLEDKKCAEAMKTLNVDFKKQTLVGWSAHSDCHMRVRIKVFRNDAEKNFLVIVNNIYGGCRAGGSRSGWIKLDKLPAGYTLNMKEVRVDRIHGINGDGKDFYFPKQPTGIKPQIMESREVDIKGCLPLDRQSQWVFIKDEFLQKALEEKSAECKAVFKDLGIDFDKYWLAGYNFSTGDCERPAGVTQKVVKDFDLVSYTLEIGYDRPKTMCAELKYHPIWVVMEKPANGFTINIEAKMRKTE